ncbi:hypothetical protein A6R71_09350 [Xanthomonas translucens pv. arrhenatheri]|nr:hypothetical protein A6R71_09350 [Xanthomonas translucens pv. arrhenatheri]
MRSEAAHRQRNQQRPITGRRVQGEIGQDGRLQARIPGRQWRSAPGAHTDSGTPAAWPESALPAACGARIAASPAQRYSAGNTGLLSHAGTAPDTEVA